MCNYDEETHAIKSSIFWLYEIIHKIDSIDKLINYRETLIAHVDTIQKKGKMLTYTAIL